MTPDSPLRYARQTRLPEVGAEGQERLASGSVLVVGAGGLGAPALHHLVASGVGRVGFVEFDTVDLTNLHRQTLYTTSDVGRPKAAAAAERLRQINPTVDVEPHEVKLDRRNADDLLAEYDLVLDGSDTFATRYVVNDASVRTGTPNVFASVSRFSGQVSVFGTETGPCYRCLFPEPPPPGLIPNCEDGGVLGVVPSLLGTIQATEALKWLLGIGDPLVGRLVLIDVLSFEVREIAVAKDPTCPGCGERPRDLDSGADDVPEITVSSLRERLLTGSPVLIDVREDVEREAGHLGGLHVPLGQLDAAVGDLPVGPGGEVVVYCQSGRRSSVAAATLQARGFRASSLRGGYDAWRAQL